MSTIPYTHKSSSILTTSPSYVAQPIRVFGTQPAFQDLADSLERLSPLVRGRYDACQSAFTNEEVTQLAAHDELYAGMSRDLLTVLDGLKRGQNTAVLGSVRGRLRARAFQDSLSYAELFTGDHSFLLDYPGGRMAGRSRGKNSIHLNGDSSAIVRQGKQSWQLLADGIGSFYRPDFASYKLLQGASHALSLGGDFPEAIEEGALFLRNGRQVLAAVSAYNIVMEHLRSGKNLEQLMVVLKKDLEELFVSAVAKDLLQKGIGIVKVYRGLSQRADRAQFVAQVEKELLQYFSHVNQVFFNREPSSTLVATHRWKDGDQELFQRFQVGDSSGELYVNEGCGFKRQSQYSIGTHSHLERLLIDGAFEKMLRDLNVPSDRLRECMEVLRRAHPKGNHIYGYLNFSGLCFESWVPQNLRNTLTTPEIPLPAGAMVASLIYCDWFSDSVSPEAFAPFIGPDPEASLKDIFIFLKQRNQERRKKVLSPELKKARKLLGDLVEENRPAIEEEGLSLAKANQIIFEGLREGGYTDEFLQVHFAGFLRGPNSRLISPVLYLDGGKSDDGTALLDIWAS